MNILVRVPKGVHPHKHTFKLVWLILSAIVPQHKWRAGKDSEHQRDSAVSNVFVGPCHVQTHTVSFTLHYKKKKKAHTGEPLGTQNINKYPSSISPWNHPCFQDLPMTLTNLSIVPRTKQLEKETEMFLMAISFWLTSSSSFFSPN